MTVSKLKKDVGPPLYPLLVVCLMLACSAGTGDATSPPRLVEVHSRVIFNQIMALKEAVDVSAKEQAETLENLRFHLTSARTGLKNALSEIRALRQEVAACTGASNISTSTGEITLPTPTPEVTTKNECSLPAEMYQSRCLVTYFEQLNNWEEAYSLCKSIGGELPGADSLTAVQKLLTEKLGVDSETRARWSVWAGARQQVNGWHWVGASCGALPEVAKTAWAEAQPHQSITLDATPQCMTLEGFNGYAGAATPCAAFRRFVCDITDTLN